jgi:alanine racemase
VPLRALARVDLGAIERNARRLAAIAEPAELCAVVKADGYGHGMVPAARAARAGGATWLAVATAEEARGLREGGLEGPVLVMGALSPEELEVAVAARADVVAWREAFVDALAGERERERERERSGDEASGRGRGDEASGRGRNIGVHVKLDTGMGRLGTRDADEATRVADAVARRDGLRLAGAMTHFATADDDPGFLAEQLEAFTPWAHAIRAAHPDVIVHAANSAATLREPAARFDLVRCGIALYGMDPFQENPATHALEPALSLVSYVAEVKDAAPGQSAGYGRRFVAERATRIGTLPIGYADGVRRGLTNNADVLVEGRRVPLIGTVSMDNITVDLSGSGAEPGAEAILIGAQGDARILAEDLARRLGTINYEVTCGISARVPRAYTR